MSSKETVLVTGGSGFLGSHCLLAALQDGYKVRTTVRSLSRADKVKKMLLHGGATQEQVDNVGFFVADLTSDDGWSDACRGCSFVLHTASPFPATTPKNENDLVVPAREGTLRALRAAKQSGTVRRVVITSSGASVSYGQAPRDEPFTEADWTVLDDPSHHVAPYPKSKTLAERAAWQWLESEGGHLELSVVNPVVILGPILAEDSSTSLEIVVRLLSGAMPGCPRVSFGAVDVRDCAQLHLLAMTHPKAAGQRFISCSDDQYNTIRDFALMLKDGLPAEQTKKVPQRNLPDFLIRIAALFDPTAAMITGELGKNNKMSNEKAKRELGWTSRSTKEGVIAAAQSVREFGMVE